MPDNIQISSFVFENKEEKIEEKHEEKREMINKTEIHQKEALLKSSDKDRHLFLNTAYDSINNHENINLKEILTSYAKKFLVNEERSVDDIINKKPDSNIIMKSISELKSKVDVFNVYDKYKMKYTGLKYFDAPTNNLNKIKY
jgi:hypothetical protein